MIHHNLGHSTIDISRSGDGQTKLVMSEMNKPNLIIGKGLLASRNLLETPVISYHTQKKSYVNKIKPFVKVS